MHDLFTIAIGLGAVFAAGFVAGCVTTYKIFITGRIVR
jgi:hypothetical protein